MKNWTRKEFLKATVLGASVPLVNRTLGAPAIVRPDSPNGDIRVAIVGVGIKGTQHIQNFAEIAGVRIVALCDVDSSRLAMRAEEFEKSGPKVARYTDYRKLIGDPTIDAVVLSTPNHWHALQTIWACQAGKDVYCEKPISHNAWEGRKAVEAAVKYKRIVQTGTQNRSVEGLREAAAYIREGNLGRIKWVRGLCYDLRESIGKTSGPQPVPAHIDYDLWTGPAALVPPRRNSANGTVHYDWHWFWNYGGGEQANQGIHHMDVARWFLDDPGLPPTVMSIGGRLGYDDDGETPNTQITVLGYEPAPLIFEVRGLPISTGVKAPDRYRGIRKGIVVQCEGGYFAGHLGGAVYDNDDKRIRQFSGTGGGRHMANFIAAVRSRKTSGLAAPLESGHVSTTLCHLANISYRLGEQQSNEAIRNAVASSELMKEAFARMHDHLAANGVDVKKTPATIGPLLKLDLPNNAFVTDENCDAGFWANTLLKRTYRNPFVVPEQV